MRKLAFSLLCVAFLSLPLTPKDHQSTDIASVEMTPGILKKLLPLKLDLLLEWEGRLYIVAEAKDLARLQEAGIRFRIETAKFHPSDRNRLALGGGLNGAYHSSLELESDLKALQSSHPGLAKIQEIGRSLENRPIYALKVSANVESEEPEARTLFIGCHHAREWISVEVPLLLGRHLLENYGQNPEITGLLDHSEIWIVPLANPDGLEYSINVYRYWRKNRRANTDGSYGVDLNRNYEYMWGYDNEGSSPDPESDVYRGSSPFSEPETRAVRDLALEKAFQGMISYHSFSQVILHPWGYTNLPTATDSQMNELAARMSALIQGVNGSLYPYGRSATSLYRTNGDTTDWVYGIFGIPAYTIELPPVDEIHGGFFNAEEDIDKIFRENLPAMLFLIRRSILDFQPPHQFPRRERERPVVRPKNGPQKND
jgi:hypothetical protein